MSSSKKPRTRQRHRARVAVLGGEGRAARGDAFPASARHFQARRYGGNGPLRSLVQSLQAGAINRVFILARWNSHATTRRVLRLCRQLGVPVEVIP